MINGIPRILIVRLSAIGDVVRVLPALHALRRAHSDAQIDWVVEQKSYDIVSGQPELDEVLVFERGGSASLGAFGKLCRDIRARRYDMVFDFHGILKSGIIAGCSGAPMRIGFAPPRSQELSHWFNNEKIKLGAEVTNRIHENLALCESFSSGPTPLDVTIFVPEEIREDVDEYFEETFAGSKFVVAMHAPVDREEKRWPASYFAELSDLLLSDGRFEVMLTWGPGQFADVEAVLKQCKRHPHVAPEMTDLKHYVWLIHRSSLYFGGDTGPMHIASAMQTPIVGVFGGTRPSVHAPLRPWYECLTAESVGEDKASLRGLSGAEKLKRVTPEHAYDACIRACVSDSP